MDTISDLQIKLYIGFQTVHRALGSNTLSQGSLFTYGMTGPLGSDEAVQKREGSGQMLRGTEFTYNFTEAREPPSIREKFRNRPSSLSGFCPSVHTAYGSERK